MLERIIKSVQQLVFNKQEDQSPSEYSEQVGDISKVVTDVFGTNIWGCSPDIRMCVIERSDDMTFDPEDWQKQKPVVQQLLLKRCSELVEGCIMTMHANPKRSDMCIETHKCLLTSKSGSAFANNRAEAVEQMVGFEQIKKAAVKALKKKTPTPTDDIEGDTASNVVLVQVTDVAEGSSDSGVDPSGNGRPFYCYECGEETIHSLTVRS